MDSGSGSLQSSSGGDDQEYDSSRAESISSFLNPSTHFASISNNPTQNPIHPPPPHSSFFDPNSSHHHHPLDHSSPFSLSHSPPVPNTTLYNNNLDPVYWANMNETILTTSQSGFSSPSPFPGPSTAARVPTPPNHHVGVVAKNPKKRTRASRRAPTTVLTTDTSNFRQMVQEFTGIPAAPFSAGSSPLSRRLDLFGGVCSAMGVGPLYPLRPSAQKLQLSSQYNLSTSSTTSPSFLNSDATTTTTTNNSIATSTDHQGFPKQPQSLLNLENNSLFSFQSLLQQQPLPNAATYSTKSDHPVGNSSMNNTLDGQQVNPSLGGFPSSSSTTRWRDHQGGEDENLVGFDGNNGNSQNVRGYKLSSKGHFQSEKGLENVVATSRGNDHQGNVDSWICPSD